jgi:hypothetical protein
MGLVSLAFSLYLKGLDRRLRRAAADPAAAQRRVLAGLVRRARDTWFGRRHDFGSIAGPADFAQAVPIASYDERLDVFERIWAGEPDVCWPGRPPYFARTSGTTAAEKHIPHTHEGLRSNMRAGRALYAYYTRAGGAALRHLVGGDHLWVTCSANLRSVAWGAKVGDICGIAASRLPWWAAHWYQPGKDLAAVDDWEARIEAAARRVVGRDVRMVAGVPSWLKVFFDRLCAIGGADSEGGLSRLWPNLAVLVHLGVSFEPYRTTFARYFRPGHRMEYLEVYAASEGFIAIQPDPRAAAMEVLTDNGIFYEFVPHGEWGQPDPPRLSIGQVERGVPYCVVLSTNSGLWAYDLGDVVEFASVRPPEIIFAGRHQQFINAFGEHVTGRQLALAVGSAADATGARVQEFTAAPCYPDRDRRVGAYQFVVEFEEGPAWGPSSQAAPACDGDPFARRLDGALIALNPEYAKKRKGNVAMTAAEVTAVPPGTFYAWMKDRGRLGGQNKVPLCAGDRRHVEDLLAFAAMRSGAVPPSTGEPARPPPAPP